ncbi:MAG: cupin domain-containing protein [Methanomassiliicoccales archaeon]|jgi:mannose-6-phosphate isomerase-like protein (cupin superfamily)|nr:cupin domain-containing protein [Methanomassiliicoccales archaeon]
MKVINVSGLNEVATPGERGQVFITDCINERDIVFGLREIEPNSIAPKRPHHHPLRQAMFVIDGTGVVTNGIERHRFKPGDFIMIDADEEHYFESEGERVRMIELRFP